MTQNELDKYRVIAQLGRGGMADVYLTASQAPGGFSKLLVVKVLQASLAREEHFLAMFRDEARLAARLNHPNVVQTYEVGESNGRHFIAMEYLEGQSLGHVIEKDRSSRKLDLGLSLRIIVDALAGLSYAHQLRDFDGHPLGVVHRDITPQNIFVTYEGQVKLVDFGIAKASDSTTETTVGTVKGKVSYMAPEQARGEKVDCRADIFSMGIILWELISGRRLWEGLTDIAVVGRLVQGAIPELTELRPEVPAALAAAVMAALEPDPSKRPQTAADFQARVETVLDNLPERASTRRLGDLMRLSFQDERAQVRSVVGKQLERLLRESSPGITPPRGVALSPNGAGDTPILGEGSSVHEAVTALHTGLTESNLTGSGLPHLGSASGTGSSALAQSQITTAVTDAHLLSQNRVATWVAIAAVGAAGLAIGMARPWDGAASQNPRTTEASTTTAEPLFPARVRPAAVPSRPVSAGSAGCDADNKPIVELTGDISEDAELTCDKEYLLRFTTYVAPGATLTIQPGTVLKGDLETKGKLVVQPGARIQAAGTRDRPIVFTSAAPEGQRRPGDWGGLILLGEAPINLQNASGARMPGHVEGLTTGGEYGGDKPNDSSGTLRYVRIEYSGTEIAPNNEINGLTLAGVGRGTVVDHVQVRHTADDCFEFFGGTVDAKYLICQHPGDDAFDWDYGYTGRLQFLVGISEPSISSGSNGFEGDNDPNGTANAPVSFPLIYNTTLCGKNRRMDAQEHYAVLLRRGTRARIRNGLFLGFSAGLDVRDPETQPNIAASTFFHNLAYNLAYPETREAPKSEKAVFDDDNGFDETVYLKNPGLRISEVDPRIGNCFDERDPSLKPHTALGANAAHPPDDGFFDPGARFVGAFRDREDDWDTQPWVTWGR